MRSESRLADRGALPITSCTAGSNMTVRCTCITCGRGTTTLRWEDSSRRTRMRVSLSNQQHYPSMFTFKTIQSTSWIQAAKDQSQNMPCSEEHIEVLHTRYIT